jgi:hypothetical protein
VAAAKNQRKIAENVLGRCGASSGHITKLEQSIFFRYLWWYSMLGRGCFIFKKANLKYPD